VLADPEALRGGWRDAVTAVLREATVDVPADNPFPPSGGRCGLHGEALGRMLSEMQSLARAFPGASW
jgi:ring-1,2-phenylacetyl-CoA epoxidase subunit PaaC